MEIYLAKTSERCKIINIKRFRNVYYDEEKDLHGSTFVDNFRKSN